jgi:hypothetical protein
MQPESQIVTEAEVEKALNYLRDSATEIGKLTTDARFAESWVKVVKAVAMKESKKLPDHAQVNAQEREALASKEYELAIREEARTAGELAKAKALREAAAMKIEVWRTQSSNWRSMKI